MFYHLDVALFGRPLELDVFWSWGIDLQLHRWPPSCNYLMVIPLRLSSKIPLRLSSKIAISLLQQSEGKL